MKTCYLTIRRLKWFFSPMYLRPIWTKRKPYWALVKSVRQGKKVRQEVVAYLGSLPKREQSRARSLAQRLGMKSDSPGLFDPPLEETVVPIRIKGIALERARQFGNVYLGMKLWEMAGFDRFFQARMPLGKEEVPWATTAMITTIARLCAPSSELRIADHWVHSTALCDMLLVDENQINDDRLYRVLDELLPLKGALEGHLKERWESMFNAKLDVMLYDVTSVYFEGQALGNSEAKRGYSRDHRGDCKQVCLGLVVTREGLPVGYEVFPGDTHDSKTVETIVTTLESRYGKSGRVWVWDRGMIRGDLFSWMKAGNRDYVMAVPKGTLHKYADLLDKSEGWQRVKDRDVEVQYVTLPVPDSSDVFLLCRSLDRQHKERAMRQLFVTRIETFLDRLKRRLERARQAVTVERVERQIGRILERYQRGGKFFSILCKVDPDHPSGVRLEWTRNTHLPAERMEGCYLLRTNIRTWSATEVWKTYIQLTQVESAFRVNKSQLDIRPVYHQTKERVRAHLFVCFLAYCLWTILEQWQSRSGLGHSPRTILESLAGIQSADVHLPTESGKTLRLRCVIRPEEHQKILLQRLGLHIPQRMTLPGGLQM